MCKANGGMAVARSGVEVEEAIWDNEDEKSARGTDKCGRSRVEKTTVASYGDHVDAFGTPGTRLDREWRLFFVRRTHPVRGVVCSSLLPPCAVQKYRCQPLFKLIYIEMWH